MPEGYYNAEGEPVGSDAQRAQGLGIPVAYINRVYNLTTGLDVIVLNTEFQQLSAERASEEAAPSS